MPPSSSTTLGNPDSVAICARRLCGGVEDVIRVLTLVRRGVAQVSHVLRVEELREQLEVEQGEEEEEVESGEGRVKERQPCG